MSFFAPDAPPPPPPPPNPPTLASSGAQANGAAQRAAAAGAFSDTNRTGPQGASAPATTTQGSKALLGQ